LLDPDVLLYSLTWTLLYGFCGRILRCYFLGTVDGFPRHSYAVALVHQMGTHPLIAVWLFFSMRLSGIGMAQLLQTSWDDELRLLERHTQYSCIACQLKDFLFADGNISNSSPITLGGFVLHHVVALLGCSMWLMAPSGAGIGTAVTLNAEITSGFYCMFKLWPARWSAALYAVTQPLSLMLGICGTIAFVRDYKNTEWNMLCQVLCVLLVTVRAIGFIMEWKALKSELLGTAAAYHKVKRTHAEHKLVEELSKDGHFPEHFDTKVDMSKVSVDVLKPWIRRRITEFVGFEDDITINYCMSQLTEPSEKGLDPRLLQVNMTGFMEWKAAPFCSELWENLISANLSPVGVPQEFIDERNELKKKKEEADKFHVYLRPTRKVSDDAHCSEREAPLSDLDRDPRSPDKSQEEHRNAPGVRSSTSSGRRRRSLSGSRSVEPPDPKKRCF